MLALHSLPPMVVMMPVSESKPKANMEHRRRKVVRRRRDIYRPRIDHYGWRVNRRGLHIYRCRAGNWSLLHDWNGLNHCRRRGVNRGCCVNGSGFVNDRRGFQRPGDDMGSHEPG